MTIFKEHLYLLAFLLLAACDEGGRPIDNIENYYAWLNTPQNGLVKTRTTNGIRLSVKYMPPEYLAYKEIQEAPASSESTKDSLVSLFQKTRTFVLTITPEAPFPAETDIMSLGMQNYEEYANRALLLNFGIEQYITLNIEGKPYKPVLATLENTYGLTKHRNIYLVFTPDEAGTEFQEAHKLDFVFNDEIFGTGINHFVFQGKDIKHIPPFEFSQH